MQLQQMFDARSISPAEVFVPLPPGDYKVRIVESEGKPTSKGDGGYLALKLEVLEGQFQGRLLHYNLNLFNASQQACEIAYRQLSALCHVTGVFQIQASEQLHGIPFVAVVAIQPNGQYNDIKGVKDLAGNIPGKGASTAVASAAPPAAAAPAWGAAPAAVAPVAAAPAPWGPPAAVAAPAPAAPAWTPAPAAAPAPAPAPAPWGPPAATAPAAATKAPWER